MGNKTLIGISILSLLFLMVACAPAPKTANTIPTPLFSEEFQEQPAPYTIGKGDVLEVITWKEPDFSREVPVRMDGKISFPLLADIQAAGRTTEEIQEEIRTQLKKYVTHPIVAVAVKEQRSQKVYIVGEVEEPGEYPIEKDLTVLQALALAGGFTEWASKKEILVIRNANGANQKMMVNYEEIEKGRNLKQNIRLQADDIIVIP